MRKELDELLCKKYPSLFVDRHASMRETAMCWGFECDDGWFNLLDELCAKIVAIEPNCKATQVKEKYGTLRFYLNNYEVQVDRLVSEAERKSGKICEVCGAEGKLRGLGWYKTLCNKHTVELEYEDFVKCDL